ncbi:TIGR03936 family radical SAM-associated protein [Nocardioides nematodiphilus]|uniref:TIGR03936 family radical SAM-associated protein n=1 Tax=Nocardioides nematodiphilus TaxID=2849669 RepID=UPI001CD94F2E|nr:TIGR03936 family radical SAM-associated protein [Nocardioides nematodiphilus]MCA1984126.1 TIGR03936 family radical SAM-associated protein [Nocardioides nematodiphilus]
MREQPEQQAPPVQRLRVRYAKRGRMRFTSHRDFSRAFERAVFRARVPMAYSSGFNPHPRISYAGASPTGAASEAEYLELALAQVVDPADIQAQLDEVMPDGLDIVDVVTSPGGALADVLTASTWMIDIPIDPAVAESAVSTFLAAESVPVERMTKRGLREFDCRAAVLALTAGPAPEGTPGTRLALTLRHVEPAVRPDDVMTGLRSVADLDLGSAAPLLTRLEQGLLDEETGAIGDPLRADVKRI